MTAGHKPMNSFHLLDSIDAGLLGDVTFEDLCDSVSDLSYFRDEDFYEPKILTFPPLVENNHSVDAVLPPLNVSINLLD